MKTKYIGLAAVILIFAIIFIPRIHERITTGTVVDTNRMSNYPQQNDLETTTQKKQIKASNSSSKKAPLSNEEIEILDDLTTNSLKNDNQELVTLQKVDAFSFTNQDGKTIDNSYYTNKVYVVEFFFTTCSSICPVMNTNMLQVQDVFKSNDDFGIASFTIDPEYDTAAVLKEYAEGYEANHPHWNFLTGTKTEILKLSNEGFKLYAAPDENDVDGFAHSGLFALVDKNGFVRSRKDAHGNAMVYYNGLEQKDIAMLIEDIKKLL